MFLQTNLFAWPSFECAGPLRIQTLRANHTMSKTTNMVPRIPPPIYMFVSQGSNTYSTPECLTCRCAITLNDVIGSHQPDLQRRFDALRYSIKSDPGRFDNAQTHLGPISTMRPMRGRAVAVARCQPSPIGGKSSKAAGREPYIVVEGLLITGQSPASLEAYTKVLLVKLRH
jgi:hypothetical protein